MKQSQFPSFVKRDFPKGEESYNAKILIRAGFVDKLMAGVYSFLPFGLRVLRKIENIVREEMDKLGAFEILMPVLTPKENWEITGRWKTFDALFKIISRDKKEYALGPTHEEIVVPLSQKVIFSYKDLPVSFYQIQTKFRDEERAKSGLLRGREFLMKDLYSFHFSEDDLNKFYEKVSHSYLKIFNRLGLRVFKTEASGGTFSKYSHEFQVFLENGEDEVIYCPSCGFSRNKEIASEKVNRCPSCHLGLKISKASEVGNIFKLGTNYSRPFSLKYKDKDGKENDVIMGCYGIGISRLMAVLAEVFHDKDGLIWPESVAPFRIHLISLLGSDNKINKKVIKLSEDIYKKLIVEGIDVLFDDRLEKTPGEKLVESDLVGIPLRAVISPKTKGKIELKKRNEKRVALVNISYLLKELKKKK